MTCLCRGACVVLLAGLVASLAAGPAFAMGAESGAASAWVWGIDSYGLYGNGNAAQTNANSPTPVPVHVPAGVVFTSVSVGDAVAVALDSTGQAWTWGENNTGELGNGNQTEVGSLVAVRVKMPPGVSFVSVATADETVVAIDASGRAWSWGSNQFGLLGIGNMNVADVYTPHLVKMPAGVHLTAVSVGLQNVVALDSEGRAWAWGDDSQAELGNGIQSTTPLPAPVAVHMPRRTRFNSVAAGGTSQLFGVATDTQGRIWEWGDQFNNALGNTVFFTTPQLVPIPRHVRFVSVAAGGDASLALTTTGIAYGWGNDTEQQLGAEPTLNLGRFGQGSSSPNPVPVAMPRGVRFVSITAGQSNGAAVDRQGRVWAWGTNQNDGLGNGSSATGSFTPVRVDVPVDVMFTLVSSTGPADTVIALAVPALANPDVSTIASSLLSPLKAFKPVTTAVSAGVAAGAVLFITFPSQIFNYTFEENYAEIQESWQRLLRRASKRARAERKDRDFTKSPVGFVAVVLIGALLSSLNDPHFGFHLYSLVTYLGVVGSIAVGAAVPALVTRMYHRRRFGSVEAHLHALPAGLAVATGCVLVSRLTGFQPGYLYGVVVGVMFTKELKVQEEGHVVALTTLTMLAVSVGAWFAWVPVNEAAEHPGAFAGFVLVDDLLAAVFVSGLVGSVLSLVPLRFLPGHALKEWHRGAWAAVLGVSLFGLIQVMIRPHGAHPRHVPAYVTVGLFVVFGIGSLAFRDYFDRKHRRGKGEPAPPLAKRLHDLASATRTQTAPETKRAST